jgi:hypothetical protein
MEQKLMSYGVVGGLVVGAWGEISEDFKSLIEVMAERKREDLEAQIGFESRKSVSAQLASYISHNRQQLSLICVQSQSRLVLDRLEAARRRGRTVWLERKWEKERQAQLIAARQGWRIRRTGDFRI